jgi:hypothetical protein
MLAFPGSSCWLWLPGCMRSQAPCTALPALCLSAVAAASAAPLQMWHLLEWQGRHPQSPVAVAQRTHYFSELNVPRTVRNLLR